MTKPFPAFDPVKYKSTTRAQGLAFEKDDAWAEIERVVAVGTK